MTASFYEIRVCENPACGLRYPLVEGHPFGARCPRCLGEDARNRALAARRGDGAEGGKQQRNRWFATAKDTTTRHPGQRPLGLECRGHLSHGGRAGRGETLPVRNHAHAGERGGAEDRAGKPNSSSRGRARPMPSRLAARLKAQGWRLWAIEQDQRASGGCQEAEGSRGQMVGWS